MKADESRSPMPVKHQLDHELPTVIHHPEEEMPLLARWVDHAMQDQFRFWGIIGGVAVVAITLSVISSSFSLGRGSSDLSWSRLELAKTPAERVEMAKDFPRRPAGRWALVQAATEYYNLGFADLPNNHDAALENLKKATGLFQRVADEADADSPQARIAAFGLARSYEASNELTKAAAQYEKVAKNPIWAGTQEATAAESLAKTVKTPEAIAFYKQLYEFKAPEVTLPPGGVGSIDLPAGHPPVNGPIVPAPAITGGSNAIEPNPFLLPPPPATTKPAPAATTDGLPADVFAPAPTTPKAPEAAKDALPGDPFAPKPETPKN